MKANGQLGGNIFYSKSPEQEITAPQPAAPPLKDELPIPTSAPPPPPVAQEQNPHDPNAPIQIRFTDESKEEAG